MLFLSPPYRCYWQDFPVAHHISIFTPLTGSRHAFPANSIQRFVAGISCRWPYLNLYLPPTVRCIFFLTSSYNGMCHDYPAASRIYNFYPHKIFGMIFLSQAGVTYFICEVRLMFFLPPPHVSLVWFQICYPPNTPTPSLPKQGSRRVFHITSIQRFTAGFSRCLSYFNFPPLPGS